MCCPRRYTGNSGRCRVATRTTGIVVCTGDEAGTLAGWLGWVGSREPVSKLCVGGGGEVSRRGGDNFVWGGGGLWRSGWS